MVEHLYDIVGCVPRLARNPPIGGENAGRQTGPVHGECNQMAQVVALILRFLIVGQIYRLHAFRHSLGAKERMEVSVFAAAQFGRMGMIVVLAVGFVVVDVALRVVVPFEKLAVAAYHLADQVVVGFAQNPNAIERPKSGFCHSFQIDRGDVRCFSHRMSFAFPFFHMFDFLADFKKNAAGRFFSPRRLGSALISRGGSLCWLLLCRTGITGIFCRARIACVLGRARVTGVLGRAWVHLLLHLFGRAGITGIARGKLNAVVLAGAFCAGLRQKIEGSHSGYCGNTENCDGFL